MDSVDKALTPDDLPEKKLRRHQIEHQQLTEKLVPIYQASGCDIDKRLINGIFTPWQGRNTEHSLAATGTCENARFDGAAIE